MASYNRTKAADRAREIAVLKDQIAAIDAGIWPRNLDDTSHVIYAATSTFNSAQENRRIQAAYTRKILQGDLDYLEAIPARVAAGELPGWEG